MSGLKLIDVRHDCELPRLRDVLPEWGARHQVMARWRCPQCGARWRYEAEFMDHERMYWKRSSSARWRWRRAERRRLLLAAASGEGSDDGCGRC